MAILAAFLQSSPALAQITDVSDSVWSIIVPTATAADIVDMGQVQVSDTKDSVVIGYLANTGPVDIRIDSIVVPQPFKCLSGMQSFVLPKGNSRQVEFLFTPTTTGVASRTVAVFTQADTLEKTIRGEGVAQQISIPHALVDFGLVKVTTHKDTNVTYIVRNIGTGTLTFSGEAMLGPDTTQFSVLRGYKGFSLLAGQQDTMTLRFAPKTAGRTSGRLGFYYNGPGSPAVVDLFGEGYDCAKMQSVVIASSGPYIFCKGDSVELDAGIGYQTYLWSNGLKSQKIVVKQEGLYSVILTDINGCSGVSAPVSILVHPLPKPVITGQATLCQGDSITIDAGAGFGSYLWSNGATTQTITVKTGGNYIVNVIDTNGCRGNSPNHMVTAYPQPVKPTITRTGDTLTSSNTADNRWYRDSILISGATNQTYLITSDGHYAVQITDQYGCKAMSDAVYVQTTATTTVGFSCVMNNTFNAGERVTIPLVLTSSTNLKVGTTHYKAQLRFNRSVLTPLFTIQASAFELTDRVITISSSRISSLTQGMLIDLPFTVTLGDTPCTMVHLDSLIWLDDQVRVTLQDQDCEICVNVCREGGTRLFSATGRVNLFQNRPNPFNAMTVIDYEIIENGSTRLIVMDMYGRTVATLVDGEIAPGRYAVSFEASKLPSGTYMTILETPTRRIMRVMEVVK
jgi:hypothetical protein